MKLQDALRKVIKLAGMGVIQDKRLLSFLSDYRAFEEFPAVRPVMSAIAEEGYGKELFRHAADESDAEYLRYADGLKNTLCVRKNFKKEVAVYAVDCISFALGLVSSVNEPGDHGYDPAGNRSGSNAQSGSTHAGQHHAEDAESLYRQGLAYKNGDGVEVDEEKSLECFRKAAWQGNADAQYELGNAYHDGIDGDSDDFLAVKWWRKAAEQGHADAQYKLGEAYENGDGVDEDDDEAEKWFTKAAEQGNADAMAAIDRLYSKKQHTGGVRESISDRNRKLIASLLGGPKVL
ncbi:MAG: tetratricopeptide repeat protein [Candidatus Cryptobacteroides sp.]|nr:tetratricopeptide repeat protein [Candidatus Cryptobacteroides sp.]